MKELSSEFELSGIGIMSGTSTDGIDLVAVKFKFSNQNYEYQIGHTKFIEYSNAQANRLLEANKLTGRDLRKLDIELATLISNEVIFFLAETNFKADFIASHGHTVFHEPTQGYTLQVGSGATIAALTGITTVSDFRQGDVSLGGQGAPLVPIGDLKLFSSYDYCLNLGGFANISKKQGSNIKAFDICALNVVMNKLAQRKNLAYDKGGHMAASGKLRQDLYDNLQKLKYYKLSSPKSLGTEWVETFISPIMNQYSKKYSVADLLHTYTEHAASQIAMSIDKESSTCLATGGGCKNDYLMQRISAKTKSTLIDYENEQLVDFKEALIFAFLGYLRLLEQPNVVKDVSGATKAVSAGAVYLP